MKQICIAGINSDSKEVCLAFREGKFSIWIMFLQIDLQFSYLSGCKREHIVANHKCNPNGEVRKGSFCCICVDY